VTTTRSGPARGGAHQRRLPRPVAARRAHDQPPPSAGAARQPRPPRPACARSRPREEALPRVHPLHNPPGTLLPPPVPAARRPDRLLAPASSRPPRSRSPIVRAGQPHRAGMREPARPVQREPGSRAAEVSTRTPTVAYVPPARPSRCGPDQPPPVRVVGVDHLGAPGRRTAPRTAALARSSPPCRRGSPVVLRELVNPPGPDAADRPSATRGWTPHRDRGSPRPRASPRTQRAVGAPGGERAGHPARPSGLHRADQARCVPGGGQPGLQQVRRWSSCRCTGDPDDRQRPGGSPYTTSARCPARPAVARQQPAGRRAQPVPPPRREYATAAAAAASACSSRHACARPQRRVQSPARTLVDECAHAG